MTKADMEKWTRSKLMTFTWCHGDKPSYQQVPASTDSALLKQVGMFWAPAEQGDACTIHPAHTRYVLGVVQMREIFKAAPSLGGSWERQRRLLVTLEQAIFKGWERGGLCDWAAAASGNRVPGIWELCSRELGTRTV